MIHVRVPVTGGSRIVSREGTTMSFLCGTCGQWLRDAMEYLRQGHVDPRRVVLDARQRGAGPRDARFVGVAGAGEAANHVPARPAPWRASSCARPR